MVAVVVVVVVVCGVCVSERERGGLRKGGCGG